MATPLMSQFLEGLHASRLLETERIEELLRRPEPPQGDLDGVARFLESQGWLTRFQIDEIRQGRGDALMFGGYRLLEKLPERPSGRTFKAFHPALQQAVVLRFVNEDWLNPADNYGGYVERARAASLVSHPNLVNVLDAGFGAESPFVVHDYVDGADLGSLVSEMGALPATLACQYVRQAALALQAAHERGIFHGDLNPARLILTPIIRKAGMNGTGQVVSMRPGPGASVRVDETGLVPRRPPAGSGSTSEGNLLGAVDYLAPERLTSPEPSARGDVYSLGATLFFLLTGRPPFAAASAAEVLQQLRQSTPVRVDSLRTDVNPGLADLVERMLAKNPEARPSSAASIAQYLLPFTQSNQPAAAPAAGAVRDAIPVAAGTDTRPNALPAVMAASTSAKPAPVDEPMFEPLPAGTSDSQVYSPRSPQDEAAHDDHHNLFADHDEDESGPAKPRRPRVQPKHSKHWLGLAIVLHVTAFFGLYLLVASNWKLWPFSTSPAAVHEQHHDRSKPRAK